MENQETQSQETTSKYDGIEDALDVETSLVKPGEPQKKAIVPNVTDQQIKDYEYSRGNFYSLIEKGQEAVDGILELAQEGQQPRSYEVVGQLIKSVGDVSDKLLDLQQKMKDLNKEEKSSPTTVNNALFVGSTAELQKLIKGEKEEKVIEHE